VADITARTAISVRTRFEVFKRDDYTCQYCGRRSPDVVLEIDHIVPVIDGGTNDPINLVAACWDCNRGKAGVPLGQVMTGEDPHDRAVMMLERERQLSEYNRVLEVVRERRERETWDLVRWWKSELGHTSEDELSSIGRQNYHWLFGALEYCPAKVIRKYMDIALSRRMTKNFKYVAACVRNWRYEHTAAKDLAGDRDDYAG
jgi:hypothetical protein